MIYLIIGASSGLGRALADKFAKEKKNLIAIHDQSASLVSGSTIEALNLSNNVIHSIILCTKL